MDNNDRSRRNNISVPSFVNENRKRNGAYIERNTTGNNGYKIQYDEEEAELSEEETGPVYRRGPSEEYAVSGWNVSGNRKKEKKRKIKLWKKILVCFLMICSVLIGHVTARVQVEFNDILSEMNREGVVDLNDVAVNSQIKEGDERIINILLVGADKRETWKEAGRSDSCMIATMDLKHKRLKLTSMMRDMYVKIPGHDDNRFNAAYSFGGVELLYRTIAENFGIRLDGYVVVDFAAFKQVINTIGGVNIELTKAEYDYLMKAYKNKKGTVLKLKEGMNCMDGSQALAYTRIRQDAKGDFGRTERQRRVLQSIFKEIKKMSLSEITALAKVITPEVTTDLSNDEIFSYLTSIIMMGTTEIDQFRIPLDDTYYQDRIRNMAVLVPDMEVNSRALYDFIYNNDGSEQ